MEQPQPQPHLCGSFCSLGPRETTRLGLFEMLVMR